MAKSRLAKLGNYLRPHWRQVGLGILALSLVNGLVVYIPLLIRDIVDKLGEDFTLHQLSKYGLFILLLASLMWVIRMCSRIFIFGVGRQVEFDLKQNIFQHLLTLEPSYFTVNTSGDLMNRATSDVDNIRRLLGFAILSIINIIFAYGFTIPSMLAINLRLSSIALMVYPLMLILVQLFGGKLRDYQKDVQEKLSDLSELVREDVSGIALIKIYAQEENERQQFAKKNRQLLGANLKLVKTRYILFPIVEGLANLSLPILLWLGSGAIAQGAMTIGDFVALVILVQNLAFPTALLGFTITAYQRGEVSIDRVEAILNAEAKVKNTPGAISLPGRIKGNLEARNLSYTYPGASKPALNNLNFTIKAGETVAIVGTIGSGKSTLANAIPRLLDLEEGQLFLDYYDITQLRLQDLRRGIAYVPQDSFLFSTTIKNNIRYGEPLMEQREVEHAAKLAQIHPEILNFPQQYETLIGERGITLSGGQRQRTSLGRALLVDSPLLILDDALSSVDNQTATEILRNLSSGVESRTVIFISHQMSAASTADRILVMDQGKIVQSGTHEELLQAPGLYQSLWQQHQLKEVLP
ncbi:MAG: ABC transporter ATP-binding protein [Prochloron sp. SP5CPC1]|nr:ABC transporter ATP-binding protein [Candidatus Paraprochloron terpiosi SP5CPC1]